MNRIFLAFLTMAVGIALSWIFLRPSEWSSDSSKEFVVLAKVEKISNDVKRQAKDHYLWETISVGDVLSLGDRVKTSGQSSVVITFIKNKSSMSLEENSLVLIDEGGEGTFLNMLEGRVFLKQAGQSKIDIKSQGKTITVDGEAEVSVDENGKSSVELIKGSAKETSSEGKISEVAVNPFTDLSPYYGSKNFVTAVTQIEWKGPKEEVELLIGSTPDKLKKVEIIKNGVHSLEFSSLYGDYYWRIKSLDKVSPLMKASWIKRQPPAPLFPSQLELIKANSIKGGIEFKWDPGLGESEWIVEIAKNPEFNPALFQKEVKGRTFESIPVKDLGQYYWRIKTKDSVSQTVTFEVTDKAMLKAPMVYYPQEAAVFNVEKKLPKLDLKWRPSEGSHHYLVKVYKSNTLVKESQVSESFYNVENLDLGSYSVGIMAVAENGEESVEVRRRFIIQEVSKIDWIHFPKNNTFIDRPSQMELAWKGDSKSTYRLIISPKMDLTQSETITVVGVNYFFRPSRGGEFHIQVELLNEENSMIAKSAVRNFSLVEVPIPTRPEFESREYDADKMGRLLLSVKNPSKDYVLWVEIKDQNGLSVDQFKGNGEQAKIQNLKPGVYWVNGYFEDVYRRRGDSSSQLKISVPNKSSIAAPKLKGIRVE